MKDQTLLFQWQDLHNFERDLFVRLGMPEHDAVIEADALTWANLRGVDSHGEVYRHNISTALTRMFLDGLRQISLRGCI